jgi:hypothetical protein
MRELEGLLMMSRHALCHDLVQLLGSKGWRLQDTSVVSTILTLT